MKTPIIACLVLACAIPLRAEETTSEITGLQKAAADFITAYNARDVAAIAALFTENGELTDLKADEVTAGQDAIKARYSEIFADADAPSIALEVESVRLVGDGLAIEDGTAHFTPPGEDEPARSMRYAAVLQKNADGKWLIASSRSLLDASDAAGQLADLAADLKGDWTCMRDGLRCDLAFGWDDSGRFLSGEMLATTADSQPQKTTLRFGWDAANQVIRWWIFDDAGGFASGEWTPTDDGWLIRSQGSTADGEAISTVQRLTVVDPNTLLWKATDRLLDGELQPDVELRLVRQAPEPEVQAAAKPATD